MPTPSNSPSSESKHSAERDLNRRDFLHALAGTPVIAAASVTGAAALGAVVTSSAQTPPPSRARSDLCFRSARELAELIRTRKLSARELMTACLDQIARVNPKINAIVAKLDDAKCLALADEADRKIARGEKVGPLHGLPIAPKDNDAAVGFPFTNGSPIYKDRMPAQDSVVVERIRQAGALFIGKTNVPEFSLGSHTYNNVYGTTYNPYDQSRSAGGSSGGAAAALATGMLPIANGSDTGGSLRNPANFNNVVGLRPTVGLVPLAPTTLPYVGLGVKGPLGRTAADAGLLLSVMAGADPRDVGTYPSNPAEFAQSLNRDFKGMRVAWSPNLGSLPLDPEVARVLASQRAAFERIGCIVEDVTPDLSGAEEAFLTLRAFRFYPSLAPLLPKHRDQMKPAAIQEAEAGVKLSGPDVSRAMGLQTEIMERLRKFQDKYEFVVCAVNQIPPFDAKLDWPKEIAGVKMEHYIAWMRSAYWITVTHRPAISVPAGFTSDGLPVGLQIVGRYRADLDVLRIAHMFEQATGVGKTRPKIAAV
jgi:amidase